MPFWFWLEILIRVCVCGVGDDWKQGKDLVYQDNSQENLLMVILKRGDVRRSTPGLRGRAGDAINRDCDWQRKQAIYIPEHHTFQLD